MMYRKNKNPQDVLYILEHLRPYDLEEVQTVHGENWKLKVFNQIMQTDFDVLMGINSDGDVPVCMGGVAHLEKDESGVGVVWMLCTDDIINHPTVLLRELKKEFKKYDEKYWMLYNFMLSKDEQAKNWLKWMGFDFTFPHPPNLKHLIPKGFEFFYRIKKPRGLS